MVLAPTIEFTDTDEIREDQDYALKLQVIPTRDENCDFNIDKVSKTLNVKTSEQLIWALENGYKPTFNEENTPAENVYNSAKAVLRQIINDDMDDVTKLRAIYEWLKFNVNYDHQAAESGIVSQQQARNYYAWSAEGVFEKGRVVCEGYAKALLIMAQIENIPTVIVTGNNHAWNKVYVNGAWYNIDATHGDSQSVLGSKNVEILTYTKFLFDDEYRKSGQASEIFTTKDYPDFEANTNYEYYKNAEFTFESDTFDLEIDSQDEMVALFKYVKNYINNNQPNAEFEFDYYEMEFCISSSVTGSECDDWISYAEDQSGINVGYSGTNTDDEGKMVRTLFIAA